MLLVDDRITRNGLKQITRARHFPVPLKLQKNDQTKVKKQILDIFENSHFLLHAGRNFELKIGKTESMTSKEVTQNIVAALMLITSLVIYTGTTKNNYVHAA